MIKQLDHQNQIIRGLDSHFGKSDSHLIKTLSKLVFLPINNFWSPLFYWLEDRKLTKIVDFGKIR